MSNKTEKKLTENCRYSETLTGSVLFRNDNGMGYRKDGSMFPYGLGSGSSDQIGYKITTVTPEMVGSQVAVFQAIEIKTLTDRISYEQIVWYLRLKIDHAIVQVYTEDRFLTHAEIMAFPRRKVKPEEKVKYEKIISNLSKILKLSND